MKKLYISLFLLTGLFLTFSAQAQIKIGTNGATIAPSSILELESQNQGLLLPRLTDTVAINALNPPNGMLIYLTRGPAVGLYVRKVSGWEYLTGSLGGNGNFNSLTVSGSVTAGNFTGPLNGNATSANTALSANNSLNSTVVNDLSTPNPVYPTFVNTTPGSSQLRTSTTKLSFIPNTGILTAIGFAGDLVGNVVGNATSSTNSTNASNTDIVNELNSPAIHYPTFVSGFTGNLPQLVSNSRLRYVPLTGALSATTFIGALNGNATSATNVTGVVALANGGTGATTKAAAFDALSPMTTAGDIIYMSPAGTGTRLPVGGPNTFLRAGATPAWSAIDLSTADVTGLLTSNKGGTGMNNAFTLSITGGNTTLNANAAGSNVTLPATGTLATTANTLNNFANTTSAQLASVITDETGAGTVVFSNTPTLITPVLGAATVTSINDVSITDPGTGATLALGNGSTLATAGAFSTTLTSTGATNVTLPTTGTLVAALSGSNTIDFPSTAAFNSSDGPTTISVPGAVDGDSISLGVPGALMAAGGGFVAWVSSPGVVTVRYINSTGLAVNHNPGVFNVKVLK